MVRASYQRQEKQAEALLGEQRNTRGLDDGSESGGRVANMRVGILGSGLMGGKLGTIFARAGHEVVFSYARSEEKLKKLARDAKGKATAGPVQSGPRLRSATVGVAS